MKRRGSPQTAENAGAIWRAMLRCVLMALAVSAASGCITENVVMPEAAPASVVSGGTPLGLTDVRDVRTSTNAASAGLLTFAAGPEFAEYLRSGVASRLANLHYSVFYAPDPSQGAAASATQPSAKVVQPLLVSADGSTSDALLQPAECEVQLAIVVYDASEKVIYQQHYTGHDQERLDAVSLNPLKAQGKILATATDAALDHAFQDPELLKAIR